MKLSWIEAFLAVANERHFGKAAESLHRTQPPISRQIRLLEEFLGVTLFNRDKHSVELTAAGKAFQQHAEAGIAQLQQAVWEARRTQQPSRHALTLGATNSVLLGVLASMLSRYQRQHPSLTIDVVLENKSQQIASLLQESIDFAIVRSLPEEPALASTLLLEEPISVALHANHPLTTHAQIELQQLEHENFIMYRGKSKRSVADLLVQFCESAGFTPRIANETDEMQTSAMLVSLNRGVALVASSMQNMSIPGIVYRPVTIHGRQIRMPLYIVGRKQAHSPVADDFLKSAIQYCS